MVPKAQRLPNGMVVMFEGIDGVGKTTQLERAHDALVAAGWPVITIRNMGGTPIGEALREVILSSLERPPLTDFYTSLAIQEPLLDVVDNARKEGKIILMDRGPLSLAAYQIFGARIDESLGWQHVGAGMNRLKPETVILYDTTPQVALKRLREHTKKPDYFESKSSDYFQRVADGYHIAAKRYPATTVVDAAQAIPDVHEQTMDIISKLLK